MKRLNEKVGEKKKKKKGEGKRGEKKKKKKRRRKKGVTRACNKVGSHPGQ